MERKATREDVRRYLEVVRSHRLIPNWWMSEEYLEKAEALWVEDGPFQGFQITEGEWFFPPLVVGGGFLADPPPKKVFAGFCTTRLLPKDTTSSHPLRFLDYQYIYDPDDFQRMSGHSWQVFRKNVRKFPRRNKGVLRYQRILEEDTPQVEQLLLTWGKNRELYDVEVMSKFILFGEHRMGLWRDSELIGMNVWDENFQFVNFRYCLDNGEPFLNEYMRYLFYAYPERYDDSPNPKPKKVNDGGSLDSDSLRSFKLKLNPCEVHQVYSWEKEG